MRRSRPISDHDDESRKLLAACRVTDGAALTLKRWPTDTTVPGLDKQGGTRALAIATRATAALQGRLVAERLWGVLLILQSMDAGGKDSTVRNVCRGIDPGGLRVTSFKAPSRDEMGQDFLRRSHQDLPARGQIGVFNRSYYEEVLITRLHPELLAAEHLPKPDATEHIWRGRLRDIAAHERYLDRQGILVRKVFLHISKEEQRRRFLRRLERPDKVWKFEAADLAERARWGHYTTAYEEAIGATAAEHAPWYVIPADHKWVARLLVATLLRTTLEAIDPQFPPPGDGVEEARRQLEAEA
jgi:PPK2 family polyphosphate:nucleotide phosphotransferase